MMRLPANYWHAHSEVHTVQSQNSLTEGSKVHARVREEGGREARRGAATAGSGVQLVFH